MRRRKRTVYLCEVSPKPSNRVGDFAAQAQMFGGGRLHVTGKRQVVRLTQKLCRVVAQRGFERQPAQLAGARRQVDAAFGERTAPERRKLGRKFGVGDAVACCQRIFDGTNDAVDVDDLGRSNTKDAIEGEQPAGRELGVATVAALVTAHAIVAEKPAAIRYVGELDVPAGKRRKQRRNLGHSTQERHKLSVGCERDAFASAAGLTAAGAVIAEGTVQKGKKNRGHSPSYHAVARGPEGRQDEVVAPLRARRPKRS
ncbi:MAG TPA: hypothetical protein PKO07_07615 [Pseudomonadota bacterium]|nr:hypothetical protein [Pseudomonadota bacterium]